MATFRHHRAFASFLLAFFAQNAAADLLFTNFTGDPVGGLLYTSGGDCSLGSCFGIGDNFEADDHWVVTGFTFYMVSVFSESVVGTVRYAVFTAGGTLVAGPADGAPTVTDTGITVDERKIYKVEIANLEIALPPGEYQFRSANINAFGQNVFPAYGTASEQSIEPGFFQLTGSQSVESVMSADVTQRTENWAFQVYGVLDTMFMDGFESPEGG